MSDTIDVIAESDLFDRLRIELPLDPDVLDRAARFAFGNFVLPYTNALQEQTNWCWAAVAKAVAHYFDGTSTTTQCSVANGTLARTDCCGAGAGTACNVPYYLQSSLAQVGHFSSLAAPLAFDAATATIGTGRPPCIRIGWKNGGGHFLAVVGYDAGFPVINPRRRLMLADPAYGTLQVEYSGLFGSRYQGAGSWTDTYYTKS